MQDPKTVRALWRLANRLETNAERVRQATKPHHLSYPKMRMLRHLMELNSIRDYWIDHYKPTRRKKVQIRPIITAYDKLSFWDSPRRYGKTRD
jgi:hypothetical protein